MTLNRRSFLTGAAAAGAALAGPGSLREAIAGEQLLFRISLAQWSLNRGFFGGRYDVLDFARIAREQFGIEAVEYVNQFYFDTLDDVLIRELRKRADGEGVRSLLIMIDDEGDMGHPDVKERQQIVARHHRWADAAAALGCHAIRVNARSVGDWDEQMKLAADGLNQLADYCSALGLSVLVENHGGLSSNGQWLAGVMRLAGHDAVGTLPDFGNFVIDEQSGESYDRYRGVADLMPWAKAVSAKSYGFDPEGWETTIDYRKMLRIVTEAGYRGWVGVEYEGDAHSEEEGVKKTMRLLERVRADLGG